MVYIFFFNPVSNELRKHKNKDGIYINIYMR